MELGRSVIVHMLYFYFCFNNHDFTIQGGLGVVYKRKGFGIYCFGGDLGFGRMGLVKRCCLGSGDHFPRRIKRK
jgi:hypothetical protein